jgi:uncharacterized protein YegP (UPF0339 family)
MFNTSFRFASLAILTLNMVACAAQPDDAQQSDTASEELVSKSAHFETFQGVDGQYYFDLVADNGQNVLRSEGYETAQGAASGIASVIANGVDAHSFTVSEAKNGDFYFNLVAQNHEIVGTSEMYASKSNATRGAKTVRALIMRTGAAPKSVPAARHERFEVFQGEDRQYYFHLRAGNGEIVLTSEGYTTKANAINGVASVQSNGASASSYQISEAVNGQYGVKLQAKNHETIAQGELYVSQSNATRAVSTIAGILGHKVTVESK